MTHSSFAVLGERDVPGWRVVRRIGPLRLLRYVVIAYVVAHVARLAFIEGSFLLDPVQPGTDIANYYAGGQRLRDGHPLYELSPGDWPVPLAPPYVTVPLLSPPLMAVIWRPLATLLSADASIHLWFVVVLTVFLATVLWQVWTGSGVRVLGIAVLAPAIALTALSGDINGLLAPLLIAAWYWSRRRRQAAGGAAIAVAAALKLTPAFLAWWLVVERSGRGVFGFAIGLIACALVSLLGSTLADHVAYLDVVAHTGTIGYTPWSVPGYVAAFGLGDPWPQASLVVVALSGTVGVWALRARPALAWAVAVGTMVFATPVVHLITLSLLLPALAPFDARRVEADGYRAVDG